MKKMAMVQSACQGRNHHARVFALMRVFLFCLCSSTFFSHACCSFSLFALPPFPLLNYLLPFQYFVTFNSIDLSMLILLCMPQIH